MVLVVITGVIGKVFTLIKTVVFVSVMGTVFVVDPVVMVDDVTARNELADSWFLGARLSSPGHVVVV